MDLKKILSATFFIVASPFILSSIFSSKSNPNNQVIILFDGVCNLCNNAVNWIIDHDPQGNVKFVSLQSESSKEIMKKADIPLSYREVIDTVILIEGNRYYLRSTASLTLTKYLKSPYPALYILIFVPEFIRDYVYEIVASNRYEWFGQSDVCRVPNEQEKSRFL